MNEIVNSVPSTTQQPTPLNIIEYMILHDGENTYTVSSNFYQSFRHQVEDILPALIPGEKYTLKMLCGPVFWNPLGEGKQRMGGKCMTDMVRRGLLPLRFAESRHEYPKWYQLA